MIRSMTEKLWMRKQMWLPVMGSSMQQSSLTRSYGCALLEKTRACSLHWA